MKTDAEKRYEDKKAVALKLLKNITEAVNKYDKDGPVNFGHVGSMGHVIDELTDIARFLGA